MMIHQSKQSLPLFFLSENEILDKTKNRVKFVTFLKEPFFEMDDFYIDQG